MKRLFIYIMMMMPLVANADAVEINGIYYNIVPKSKAAEVTSSPTNYSGAISIPSFVTYGGTAYSVTSIGEKAFYLCDNLTSVTIPNSVTSIGSSAFYSCSGLTSIDIPSSVTSIGMYAFQSCSGLTSITIPSSVTSMGSWLFGYCRDLVSVTLPDNTTSIGAGFFYQCTSLSSVTIPNKVTSIGNSSFYECKGLTSLTLPNSLTSIDYQAFYGCTGLTSITLPNSVRTIESNAFSGCTGFTSVTIGSGVKYIYGNAFSGCKNLMNVYCLAENVPSTNSNAFKDSYPENITLHVPETYIEAYKAKEPWNKFKDIVDLNAITPDNPETISNPVEVNGIYYNIVLKAKAAEVTSSPTGYSGAVSIPSSVTYGGVAYSVTSIGEKAFYTCQGLTSVSIPNSVTSIGSSAFYSCSGLTSIDIPSSVTSIGMYAFQSCSGLTSITIPSSVTSMGSWLFGYCRDLVSVTLPDNTTSIGAGFFYQCTSLSSVTIPNKVTSIGNSSFYECKGLTSLTLPNSLTSIDYQAFYGCTGLTSITLPNSVRTIESNAFSGCTGFTSVTIGSGVKYIYGNAFSGCKNLMDVYCLAENVPSTYSDAFSESYQESISLHVPAKSINAYKATEPWSKFYEIVAIEGIVEPESPKCATPEIKFSNDTFTFSCATQGVEFVSVVTVSDAKKYYDAKIKLAQTYKISVYATKNGYERSDIATKEIVITNDNIESAEILTGDVNGDGVVNVADHVKLSDIIMKSKGSLNGKK